VNRLDLAQLAQRMAAADLEPPRPGTESALARIFAEVLEVPNVGRRGNFFHLGGDSMRAVRVLADIEATLGARIDMELLFDHPTVAELAERVAALTSTSRSP
jgi:acyl carrier protein